MTNYNVANKTYVKSKNSIHKIMSRYTYTLIIFMVVSLIINFLMDNKKLLLATIKSTIVSLIVLIIITYLINLIKKKYSIKDLLVEDNILADAIILGFFGATTTTYLVIAAAVLTGIVKKVFKNINLSAPIYGILLITIYNTYVMKQYEFISPLNYLREMNYNVSFNEILNYGGGILNYLFGIYYLMPVLAIIMFIYLFYKKGIKYNVVIYYLLTVIMMLLIYGLFKGKVWLVFPEILSSSILFLSVYILTDYKATPTINESCIIYGIVLGIMTVILKFIIPEFAVIIPIIFGGLILSKILDKISYKLKYQKKIYNLVVTISIFLVIIVTALLIIIY